MVILFLIMFSLIGGMAGAAEEPVAPARMVYLSDLTPRQVHCYGALGVDKDNRGAEITIAGKVYKKGLFTHPRRDGAYVVYAIGGEYTRFQSTIGLSEAANGAQLVYVIYKVYADGREIYCSDLMLPGENKKIDIDISDVKELTLFVDPYQTDNCFDYAAWGVPALVKETGKPLPVSPGSKDINIALPENGGRVLCSDANASLPEINVNDGDIKTCWTTPINYPESATCQISWVIPKTINKVRLYHPEHFESERLNNANSQFPTIDYTIQYWDGENWGDVSGMPIKDNKVFGGWREHIFDPVYTDKIRVKITESLHTASMGLAEFEVYEAVESLAPRVTFGERKEENLTPDRNLEVHCAYFRPDPNVVEGREITIPYKKEWMAIEDFSQYGAIHTYLINKGEKPITIKDIYIGENKIDSLFVDFDSGKETFFEDGKVMWYRTRPQTLLPGDVSETIVRFRKKPVENPVSLKFITEENAFLTFKVDMSLPVLKIGYVAFSPEMDKIYIYVEKDETKEISLAKVFLDGEDVTSKARFYAPDFFHRVSLVRIDLSSPLKYGSYHVIKIVSARGEEIAHQVKAWDSFFIIGLYANFQAFIDDYQLHQANTYIPLWMPIIKGLTPLGAKLYLDLLQVRGLRMFVSEKEDMGPLRKHPALLGYFLRDEIDCVDDPRVQGNSNRTGRLAMPSVMTMNAIWERDPQHLAFLNLDMTVTPFNWYCYAQLPDALSVTTYPLKFRDYNLHWVHYVTDVCRQANAPKPFLMTLEAYSRPEGYQKGPQLRRGTEEEERIMVHYAIGCGVKGITYFMYTSPTVEHYCLQGFWGDRKMTDIIGRINIEIKKISHLLSKGHPLNLVTNSPEGLWVRTLLCGENDIILVAINENYESNPAGFTNKPLKDVKVEIDVPDWMKVKRVYAVRHNEDKKVNYYVEGKRAFLNLGEIPVSEVIVISGEPFKK